MKLETVELIQTALMGALLFCLARILCIVLDVNVVEGSFTLNLTLYVVCFSIALGIMETQK